MLTRIALVCGISAVGFAQADRISTAREVLEATLKDLHGRAEVEVFDSFTNPWAGMFVPGRELVVVPQTPKEIPQGTAISVGRLSHKISSRAMKAYRKARQLAETQKVGGAIDAYQHVVA